MIMKNKITFLFLLFSFSFLYGQTQLPCSYEAIVERMSINNPNIEEELKENEKFIADFLKHKDQRDPTSEYVIPVVMHVFHDGDDGMMGMEQALSGLEVLNNDFNGLNDGWETIDPAFDPIKGTLDITFCLATIDPDGNPTTGINYYDDPSAMLNQGNLFQHAWDNRKYLNIYFPKYTNGAPSDFTAYAYYPSEANVLNNTDGIFYSSIRWGYGEHSELDEGQDWASVCSHEAGHWLNLRHTFEFGCNGDGDYVKDTPLTLGSGIELQGCNNNDFSCDVQTNGSNFMDYNHDCKKMFTQGQVDRMLAALQLPARNNLWSYENLVATGCQDFAVGTKDLAKDKSIQVFPNPATNEVQIRAQAEMQELALYTLDGTLVETKNINSMDYTLTVDHLDSGIYFYKILSNNKMMNGKIMIVK